MTACSPSENWYALRTKPRAEKKVLERLTASGYNAYLPLVTTLKVWSDRKKKVQTPLISSYVFVKTTPKTLFETLTLQGTAGVLRLSGKPAIIREAEIENLKILMKDTNEVEALEDGHFKKGEDVEVVRGPFTGLIAKAVQVKGKYRIIVSVTSLGVSFNVNIAMSFVQKTKAVGANLTVLMP